MQRGYKVFYREAHVLFDNIHQAHELGEIRKYRAQLKAADLLVIDDLRFIATIKFKEATASDLYRRLDSYSKQRGLYQALKAFGQIPKSLFILRYIDETPLRMAIEKVLNGVEHVHRFTRAVSVGSPREYLQAEKDDQQMAEIDDLVKRAEFIDAFTHGSAVTWRHVNLLGEYDFSEEKLKDSVGIKPPKLIG